MSPRVKLTRRLAAAALWLHRLRKREGYHAPPKPLATLHGAGLVRAPEDVLADCLVEAYRYLRWEQPRYVMRAVKKYLHHPRELGDLLDEEVRFARRALGHVGLDSRRARA